MTPLGKYIWLIKLLQKKDGMTFDEINEKWLESRKNKEDKNIPILKRTFHNHINAIREEYGIHIVCGSGYRYYIEDSEYEVASKVERLSILNMMNETVSVNRSLFINDYFEILRDQTVIAIMDAIKAKRKIILDFHLLSLPEEKYRVMTVAPYQLHYFSQKWFLLGQADGLGLMRIPLFLYTGKVQITNHSYKYPVDYSPEVYGKKIYGITNERIRLDIMIQDLHPERLNLGKYPMTPFQKEVEYGYNDGKSLPHLNKYNVRVSFDLPRTPFAFYILKSKLDLYAYTVLNDRNPFEFFTEKQYENDVYYPVVF